MGGLRVSPAYHYNGAERIDTEKPPTPPPYARKDHSRFVPIEMLYYRARKKEKGKIARWRNEKGKRKREEGGRKNRVT